MPKLTDLLGVLKADHRRVDMLICRYERLRPHSPLPLQELVADVCEELETHSMIEHQIFHPALQRRMRQKARVAISEIEHQCVDYLVAELRRRRPEDPMYAAAFRVLARQVRQHMRDEERHLFAMARRLDLDLLELGLRAQTLRKSLLGQQDIARSPAITGPDAEADARHLRGEQRYRDVARH